MKSSNRGVKFCPKCGSTEIFWASGLPQLWSVWECRECGYRGALVIEDSKMAKEIRRDFSKKKDQEKSKHTMRASE